MSKFLTGKALSDSIENIIWGAEVTLMIVSPYIKLDDHFKKLFDQLEKKPSLHLLLVFGKNEKSVQKSMSKNDFDYFKKFPNVSIIYVPNLHAKYYGNEIEGVITSINLYDYSFIHNIEFGVFSQQSLINRFTQSADNDAWEECYKMAESNEAVFIRRPIFETRRGILSTSKNFMGAETLLDSTDNFYGLLKSRKTTGEFLIDFPDEIDYEKNFEAKPIREKEVVSEGYCIRTGVKIKFNPKHPMSRDAWKKWSEFGNEEYPEKYCHKTGSPSNGKTSMKNPVLM